MAKGEMLYKHTSFLASTQASGHLFLYFSPSPGLIWLLPRASCHEMIFPGPASIVLWQELYLIYWLQFLPLIINTNFYFWLRCDNRDPIYPATWNNITHTYTLAHKHNIYIYIYTYICIRIYIWNKTFQNTVQKAEKGRDLWETGNRGDEPYCCPSFLPPESPGHSAGRGNPGRDLQTPWVEQIELGVWENKATRVPGI